MRTLTGQEKYLKFKICLVVKKQKNKCTTFFALHNDDSNFIIIMNLQRIGKLRKKKKTTAETTKCDDRVN